jgi:hypothetical protein
LHQELKKKNMPRTPKVTPAAQPAPAAEPKRRGRKPGSKNKVTAKKRGRKPGSTAVNVFSAIEKEMKALGIALAKAKNAAAKQVEKAEAALAKAVLRAEKKAEKKIEKLKAKVKGKSRGPGRPAKTRGPGRPKSVKPAAKRGRPPKNQKRKGGRPKKGQPTKKTMIIDFVNAAGKPVNSGEIINHLFASSGEINKKSFAQGIYTTLTQIYRAGLLTNKDGMISMPSAKPVTKSAAKK